MTTEVITTEENLFLIFNVDDVKETEYWIESENTELQAMAVLLADDSRDMPGYSKRWPGDEPDHHPRGSYYIEDKSVLDNLAQQFDETVCDLNA